MNPAGDRATLQVNQTSQRHFPCQQCGADLLYVPGQKTLQCDYCGYTNPIEDLDIAIKEYDFHHALQALARAKHLPLDSTQFIKCPNCSATFELQANQHAGDCPFCGTPVVSDTEQARLLQPKALLAFNINEKQAQAYFDKWINGLWFAPSALKSKAVRDEKLTGVYVPYWTYDSQTESYYQGLRGTVYYERRVVTQVIDGRPQQRVVSVPRIRWTPASGRVSLFFDDVLVGASRSLPRKILDRLEPWDLRNLVPYKRAYLSGFQSEVYQVDLDEGFQHAQALMEQRIRQAVREDIGGDQQQIKTLDTHHSDTTFKHVLLPVWSAAFRYQGKIYRFVVNGRNGRTQGERPYSAIKIALAAIVALIGVALLMYVLQISGAFEQIMQQGMLIDYHY
ncbi:MAG: primosomal protein N' (replication factor Y) - superfamily II helicase [Proteobacteria bacterium]|nr:MAG: primosomal protein N' (replication factor Y) - superfamily II helicase [Pseudomonadota bacterium]